MRLTNTLTGAVETFRPLEDGRVGIYVCGVTPYEESHFGHAQYAIIFDAFVRYLRWEGSPGGSAEVTYVSNYTDIDDKVIDRAAELGRDPLDLVNEQIDLWERQQRALNLQQPDVRPRVTEHIETIVEAIEAIIGAGYGYATATAMSTTASARWRTTGSSPTATSRSCARARAASPARARSSRSTSHSGRR